MSTHELSSRPDEMQGGNLAMDWHSIHWGVVILLVSSCFGNWDKLQLGGLLCSQTDFTFIILSRHHPFLFVIQ